MRNSMTQQRRFTKEFEEEAVGLAQTSGRTQREIASDLGIGLSRLVRWIGRSREGRAVDPAAAQSEVTAELKRLRRENEILRQERDILKKATAFSPGRDVDEVRAHRRGGSAIPRPPSVPRARRQPKRLFRLERAASLPPPTRRHGAAGTCPVGLCPLERPLWQSPDEAGIAGCRPGGRAPSDGSPEARQRPAGSAEAAVQADHGQPSRLAGCAEPARSGLYRNRARQEVER